MYTVLTHPYPFMRANTSFCKQNPAQKASTAYIKGLTQRVLSMIKLLVELTSLSASEEQITRILDLRKQRRTPYVFNL